MTRRLSPLLLLFCAAGFGFGLFYLFKLRFEMGDVYPPYSSLRADPLGVMALYESLERVPGLAIRRDFNAGNRLPEEPQTTYLHLAGQRDELEDAPEELAGEVERFVGHGGRLAITFYPETTKPFAGFPTWPPPTTTTATNSTATNGLATNSPATNSLAATNLPIGGPVVRKSSSPKGKPRPFRPGQMARGLDIKKRLGVDFDFVALAAGEGESYQPAIVRREAGLPLPERLDWHSGMVFSNLDSAWKTIYARGTNPVVIERRIGSGTIVMATDSYFLSNEALLKDRHAELLAWLVGSGKEVVFDEAHLGIVENPGVASLMRKYRLHGFIAGLLLLAGLFIWKNALSFVPPSPEEARPAFTAGRDAASGFVNLLRRNIPPRDLLGVCFAEWTKSLHQSSAHAISRVDRAQAVFEAETARPERGREPVRAYQDICRALSGNAGRGSRVEGADQPASSSQPNPSPVIPNPPPPDPHTPTTQDPPPPTPTAPEFGRQPAPTAPAYAPSPPREERAGERRPLSICHPNSGPVPPTPDPRPPTLL
jgi:hypothetical protein